MKFYLRSIRHMYEANNTIDKVVSSSLCEKYGDPIDSKYSFIVYLHNPTKLESTKLYYKYYATSSYTVNEDLDVNMFSELSLITVWEF